jgi:organic hydroperoxide reductase OsmC/OhrA
MPREHQFEISVLWTGNTGTGTSGYRSYSRNHEVSAVGKAPIAASSDPVFRGDAARYNPEEMLVASLSACHMLWYLHLCAEHGVVVTGYRDSAFGLMREEPDGRGAFTEVVLRPVITIREGSPEHVARSLHEVAHRYCFIANSVNFPVRHEATVIVERAR